MKNLTLLFALLIQLTGLAQTDLVKLPTSLSLNSELPKGIISGQIYTTDHQAAAFVSVQIKGTNRMTITDEQGFFSFRNLKEGVYTLEVSMVGLSPKEINVALEKDGSSSVIINLSENARELEGVLIKTQKNGNNRPISIGKIDIPPMDLPQSFTVIGQGLIRDQQVLRLSDVVRNVNGVYLATTRASTQENFSARGYAFSNSNLFKNGSRINSGAMPEMSSLEKVEVLKGSSAILFGNVAPGGIINMVTKQPRFDFGGELSLRGGSYNLYKPSIDLYGPISRSVAYRINGTYEKSDSYRDVVQSTRYYVNPSFLFKLGKRTELIAQGDYLKHKFTPDFGIGSLENTKISALPRSAFVGAAWSYASTRQATGSISVKHRITDSWRLNVNSSYQHYSRDYYSTERIQAAADGKWARPLGRQNTVEDYFLGQVDLNGRFKTGTFEHTLLAGVDADRYFTTAYTFNQPAIYDTINILDPSLYTPRTDIPATEKIRSLETPILRFGAYVQDLVSISKKIKILAGIRWSLQEARPSSTTNLITKEKTRGASKTDKAFSPRIGLVYRPKNGISVFASYANSFSVNNGTDVFGKALDPSIIDQFEAGIKNEFFNGRLSANLTVYRIINNNLAQTAPFGPDGVTPNNNTNLKQLSGITTSDGIELDLVSHPVTGMDITAGYSYNYMRFTKTPDAKGNYVEGERVVNTPAHTANGSMFYNFQQRLKGLKIGASIFYIGNRFGGWNNTKEQAQNYSRLIPVSGFTTIDVTAGYTWKKISAVMKMSNLTNTLNYYVHENYSINPIPPRMISASVSYKF